MPEIPHLPTLVHYFARHVREHAAEPCLIFRRDGRIVSFTWSELAGRAMRMAKALESLGVTVGDRVAIASPNRWEWIVADLAVLSLGGVNVPLHASLTGPQMRFQIVDSGARAVLLAGDEQAEKLATAGPLPEGLQCAAFDATKHHIGNSVVPQWTDLAPELDAVGAAAALIRAETSRKPDELATILYTSGTTGEPKGVMLTHGNLASNALAIVEGFRGPAHLPDPKDRRLNLLPLSHIYARTCDYYCWLVAGSELALAGSPLTAVDDCKEMQPTLFNAVPYFYDRMMRKVIEIGFLAKLPGMLKRAMGGRVRHCCSGGAPLPDHVAQFFLDKGVLLTQGYGLTESSPVITMNTPFVYKHGTVGQPIPGVEVKIADDGEVLTRGPHVMQGYWNRPAETAAALEGGWLHTGDLGEIDSEGFLKITGRKKELIVTSGGKKVVPVAVETLLCQDPLVKQAVVIGDARKYLTALVVPDIDKLQQAAKSAGLNVAREKLCDDPRVADMVCKKLCERLKSLSHYEQIQRIALLPQELSVDGGEMTLKLTYRRGEIAKKYCDVIERMYSELHIPTG